MINTGIYWVAYLGYTGSLIAQKINYVCYLYYLPVGTRYWVGRVRSYIYVCTVFQTWLFWYNLLLLHVYSLFKAKWL